LSNMGLDKAALRIIDANLNRSAEGLRVVEDVARLVLNHSALSSELKALRHSLVQTGSSLQMELVWSRDAAGDVGRDTLVQGEAATRDLPSIIVANARRLQESLRVLEEMAKAPGIQAGLDPERFKQARFRIYTIEKEMLALVLRRDKLRRLSGLYVIIDGDWLKGRSHAAVTRGAIEGGAGVIQLRDKSLAKKHLLPLARELRHICLDSNVLFLINDYLDVALDCEADGLHVGQNDLPVEVARKLLRPDQILGCSVSTVAEALAAQSDGADHLGVGSIFATSTKDVSVVGIESLRVIKKAVSVPVVAIGGINRGNVAAVMEAGADAAAVITAVTAAEDPTRAARDLVNILEGKR
jgi:thiamine-phosphate pyrophosphorylase